jgi:hypothetical protein
MADDRSLKDVIRFVDPSGDITDADIAAISGKLKFTEVLDIITAVGKDDLSSARKILANYDNRFASAAEESITNEYSNVPQSAPKTSGFKPIKPIGSTPTIAGKPTNPNGQQGQDDDTDAMLADPANANRPEVKQIQSLLQRMKR